MAELLKRAATLQQNNSNSHPGSGLTLSEMEEVAAEAGLDPVFLRQAALELDGGSRDPFSLNSDTTSTHNLIDRFIPNVVTDEGWDDLVAELRHRFDSDVGQAMGVPQYGKSITEKNGNIYEWRHTSMSGVETRALLRPRREGYHLQMSQRVGWGSKIAESITYGIVVASLIGLITGAVNHSALLGFTVFFLSFLGSGGLIYFLDDKWRKKKHNELHKLADRATLLLNMGSPIQKQKEEKWSFDEHDVTEEKAVKSQSILEEDIEVGEKEDPELKKQRGKVR